MMKINRKEYIKMVNKNEDGFLLNKVNVNIETENKSESEITKALNIKNKLEKFTFRGYLSTFGNYDRHGDRMLEGCFDKSIANKQNYPLLYQHNQYSTQNLVGTIRLSIDEKGLFAEGIIDYPHYSLIRCVMSGAINTMSIGFAVRSEDDLIENDNYEKDNYIGGFDFLNVDIIEGSIVITPANPEAIIEPVNSYSEDNDIKSIEDDNITKNEDIIEDIIEENDENIEENEVKIVTKKELLDKIKEVMK